MTPSEAILKIRQVLFGNDTPAVETEVTLASAKLADGTEVSYDRMEVGGILTDASGNAMADGEYAMEDGSTLVITEGAISEIKPMEATDETPTAEAPAETPDETPAETPEAEEEAETIPSQEERISAMEANIATMIELITSLVEKNNLTLSEMEVKMSEIANQPATETIANVALATEAKPATRFERMSKAIDQAKKQK